MSESDSDAVFSEALTTSIPIKRIKRIKTSTSTSLAKSQPPEHSVSSSSSSWIYAEFSWEGRNDNGQHIYKCKRCNKCYSTSGFCASSNLIRHFKTSHNNIYQQQRQRSESQHRLISSVSNTLQLDTSLPSFQESLALMCSINYAPVTSVTARNQFNAYLLSFKAGKNIL